MKHLTVVLIILASLYGASYQQYRHFNIDMPRGSTDANSYIAMSHGDFDVMPVHRYRIIIPFIAGGLQSVLENGISDVSEVDKLSFYIINFLISGLAAFLLFLLFIRFGFRIELSLLGTLLFICSRIVVLSTATPLVDSLFYLSIVCMIFLIEKRNVIILSVLLPLMLLSKETFLPLLFLPLLITEFRKTMYIIGIIFSLLIFFGVRSMLGDVQGTHESSSLVNIVSTHARNMLSNLKISFTATGLHDWQNGFSFILILSMLGFRRDYFDNKRIVPSYLIWIIPLAIIYGLLSGNLGRMLFTAFIPIYAYALIFIDSVIKQRSLN